MAAWRTVGNQASELTALPLSVSLCKHILSKANHKFNKAKKSTNAPQL